MSSIKEDTMEFLRELPQVNSVSSYGSGYFTQGEDHQIQAMDLIVSVDNPNHWHTANFETNPEMYAYSGKKGLKNLLDNGDTVSFPKSIGCFFTDYKGREYKLLVVDKRLLYEHLTTWSHLSLVGRFQKEMKLLVDNSDGVLPDLMKQNYESAMKTGLLMNPETELDIQTLFENIASISYQGDIRTIFKHEDPNKIKHIVDGSHEFFIDTYTVTMPGIDIIDNHIIKGKEYNEEGLFDTISTLPDDLKKTLYKKLWEKDIEDPILVARTIKEYLFKRNFIDSIQLGLRCNQTVGREKSTSTRKEKQEKGRQKVIK